MRTKATRNSSLKSIGFNRMALLFATLITVTACTTTSPPPPVTGGSTAAYAEGVPGGVMVTTVDISAKVTAIDTANRQVTLLGPDGKKVTVKVGPEAINFDQVRVGDLVNATVTKELVVYIGEAGASASDGSAAMAALAPKGAQPGGMVAGTTQATGTVVAIDRANRTATLLFDDGSSHTFAVRDDIDLDQRSVGEKVVFQVTEMIAISVKKP